jgi:DDE family transposase
MSCGDISYDRLFAAVYTVVDDWYQAEGWQLVRSRPGVKPTFTDSEVLTVEIVRDLDGERRERRWYGKIKANWTHLFPHLPERSVLHKRTKSLRWLLDRCRCAVRDRLVDPADGRRLLDGTPVPVCDVSRVARPDGSSAGRQWHAYGAQIGRCAARAWWFYGFKLVLTATVDMLPDQAVLVPAAADEREAAAALLAPGQLYIADRNFNRWAAPTWLATLAHVGCGVLAPPPRRHAAEQDPAERAFLRAVRNRVESLIGQLKSEHGLEDHGARSWWGLQTRLAGILAAYTMGRYLVMLGVYD